MDIDLAVVNEFRGFNVAHDDVIELLCVCPLLQHAEGFYRDEVDEFHTQKEKVSTYTLSVHVCIHSLVIVKK